MEMIYRIIPRWRSYKHLGINRYQFWPECALVSLTGLSNETQSQVSSSLCEQVFKFRLVDMAEVYVVVHMYSVCYGLWQAVPIFGPYWL